MCDWRVLVAAVRVGPATTIVPIHSVIPAQVVEVRIATKLLNVVRVGAQVATKCF